jgi:hypothetical protein
LRFSVLASILTVAALGLGLADCSGSGGTATTALPGPTASAGGPTPTPTPTPTASPATVGSITCTAPMLADGNFTSIETTGVVTGNTYTQQSSEWEVITYSPSPTPSPGSTATPAPTPTPTAAPTPTSTPVMLSEYYGEYTVPSFNGNTVGGGLYTAAATNGCFFLILEQPVGGVIAQARSRPQASPTPNTFGDGEPNESGLDAETFLVEGSMTSLTINSLTPTSGSGSFSFTNSAANTVSGSITITGSQTFVANPADSIRRFQGPGRGQ